MEGILWKFSETERLPLFDPLVGRFREPGVETPCVMSSELSLISLLWNSRNCACVGRLDRLALIDILAIPEASMTRSLNVACLIDKCAYTGDADARWIHGAPSCIFLQCGDTNQIHLRIIIKLKAGPRYDLTTQEHRLYQRNSASRRTAEVDHPSGRIWTISGHANIGWLSLFGRRASDLWIDQIRFGPQALHPSPVPNDLYT